MLNLFSNQFASE